MNLNNRIVFEVKGFDEKNQKKYQAFIKELSYSKGKLMKVSFTNDIRTAAHYDKCREQSIQGDLFKLLNCKVITYYVKD